MQGDYKLQVNMQHPKSVVFLGQTKLSLDEIVCGHEGVME